MSRKAVAHIDLKMKNLLRTTEEYSQFEKINGTHPLQEQLPEGMLLYPVRKLEKGRVTYFNFDLARDMGLLSKNHPNKMNPNLEKIILNTFCIQIINEYDQQSEKKFDVTRIKPHKFMATRYLQLQHKNKKGATSGDGRSIWNGVVTHEGTTWDVSSRGTGVTALSPGAVEAARPLKTGEEEFGYGCGLAEVEELYGSAIMSEIFHRQGLSTERVLTVIDIGKGLGIGVRAAPNLLRPAHMFLYLKQNRYAPLKKATQYFIDRQMLNRVWKFEKRNGTYYDSMLSLLSVEFAKFAAQLERNYIFVWLDWDGDNLLAHPGIIDYGSVRQFGIRHDQYRYDDVQRYSTNLNEQRQKARFTVQIFCQLVDYLKTKNKKSLSHFAHSKTLKQYDAAFEQNLRLVFLQQVGMSPSEAQKMIENHSGPVNKLYQDYLVLEKTKTCGQVRKLPDGINHPAIFNMRAFLREYPQLFKGTNAFDDPYRVRASEVFQLIQSSFASQKDKKLTTSIEKKILKLQKSYSAVLKLASQGKSKSEFLSEIISQSYQMNFGRRITGNSIEYLVSEVMKAQKKSVSFEDIHIALDAFYKIQSPKVGIRNLVNLNSPAGELYQKLLDRCLEFEEDI
jgi:hypothetical protein